MTVSRSGKRGKPKMRPAGRNGRVRRNAGCKATTRPGLAFATREISVSIGMGHRAADLRPANSDDNLNPYALQHGRYEAHHTIFRPSFIETEYEPRVVNKTITVVDGWIDDDVFGGFHIRVIEIARDLWRDIRFPRHVFFDPYDPEERSDGLDAERAKNLLRRCRRLVGCYRWGIFENVVRWNEPTGVAGSRIATVSEASIAAAQEIVREVAEEIGRARIL